MDNILIIIIAILPLYYAVFKILKEVAPKTKSTWDDELVEKMGVIEPYVEKVIATLEAYLDKKEQKRAVKTEAEPVEFTADTVDDASVPAPIEQRDGSVVQ